MVGVTGSIPVAPTIKPRFFERFWHHPSANGFEVVATQSRFNRKQGALATLGQQTHDAIGGKRYVGERPRVA